MDEQTFSRIYGLHGTRVLRYCLFRLGSKQDAEDAAAETFARLIESDGRVREESAESWLIAVASRLCTDAQRHARRQIAVPEHPEAWGRPESDGAWAEPEVWEAVRGLTPAQQRVVFLRTVEDLPFARIASLTRTAEPAVRMLWHRALRRLRKRLGRMTA